MARFIQLDEKISVSPQLWPEDIEKVAVAGFCTIICNRPDNEVDDQPSAAQLRAIARNLGIQFHEIPVGGLTFGDGYVDRMAEAVRNSRGPVLAYCRSGLRSALIWALASVREGADANKVIGQVETAGFPTRVIRTSLGTSNMANAIAC